MHFTSLLASLAHRLIIAFYAFYHNKGRLTDKCATAMALDSTKIAAVATVAAAICAMAPAGHAQEKAKEQAATLKLLTLAKPSVSHNLKKTPPTAQQNPIESLMRPPLMALDQSGNWRCLLCTEPPKLIHGKKKHRHHKLTIALTLKDGLFWNDGKRLSALDVKHTIEQVNHLSLAETGQHRIRVYRFKLFPKKPRTIHLEFVYQNQNHLPSLAVPLLPAHLHEKFKERRPVLGTKGFAYGPYTQLTAKGNLYWLRANPYLKTPPNPSFQSIHIAAVKTLAEARLELSKRNYDAVLDFYPSITELRGLASLPAPDLLMTTGHKQAVIVLNLRNPIFAKPIHRQALWRQIKTAELPQSLLPPGMGLRADSFSFPAGDGSAFWQEGWLRTRPIAPESLAYWEGKPIELAIANTPDRIAIAQKIQEALAAAGIKLSIKRYKSKYFLNTILRKGRFDTLALMMREGLPGRTYFENFHSNFVPKYPAYKGSNFGSWYNKQVNLWLENQLYNSAQFAALQHKIERAYLSDIPEIPLFFWPKVMITRGDLSHVPLARHGFSPLLYIEKWRKLTPGAEVSVKEGQ